MIKLDIIFHKNCLRQLHIFCLNPSDEKCKKKLKTDVKIIIVILMCKKHKMFCFIPQNFYSFSREHIQKTYELYDETNKILRKMYHKEYM